MNALEDAYRVLDLDIDASVIEVCTRYEQIMREENRPDGRRRTNMPAVHHCFRVISDHLRSLPDVVSDDYGDYDYDYSDRYCPPPDFMDSEQLRESKFNRPRPCANEGYRANTDPVAVAANEQSLLLKEKVEKQNNKSKKKKKKKKKKKTPSPATNNNNTPETRNENETSSDSDGEGLDLNSAFAKASRKAVLDKTTSTNGNKVDNKRPVCRPAAVQGVVADAADPPDSVRALAQSMAMRANQLTNQGEYGQAVSVVTQAIKLDPCDHRFFGNRSFCHERLRQYDRALKDAEQAIQINPSWPKGFFRKGRALLGRMKYDEAEEAFSQVLKLDKSVCECVHELEKIMVFRIMSIGFSKERAKAAVKQYKTQEDGQQAAIDALLRGDVRDLVQDSSDSDDDTGQPTGSGAPFDPKEDPSNVEGLTSLWVGNVMPSVSERELQAMFARHGAVTSVRQLPDRFCAFINFGDKKGASRAMQHLQGIEFHGKQLKIKFPDNPIVSGQQKVVLGKKGVGSATGSSGAKKSCSVGDGECSYWRTSECLFGASCKYKHIPANKGIDRKQWRRP